MRWLSCLGKGSLLAAAKPEDLSVTPRTDTVKSGENQLLFSPMFCRAQVCTHAGKQNKITELLIPTLGGVGGGEGIDWTRKTTVSLRPAWTTCIPGSECCPLSNPSNHLRLIMFIFLWILYEGIFRTLIPYF